MSDTYTGEINVLEEIPSKTNLYIIMTIIAAAAAFGIIRRFK